MGADGEAVRLVAQPLDEIEHRIARLEHEGGPAGQMKMLAPGIAVRPLGDRHHGKVAEAQIRRALPMRCAELAGPPSISTRSGHTAGWRPLLGILRGRIRVPCSLSEPREAAVEDLAHHARNRRPAVSSCERMLNLR